MDASCHVQRKLRLPHRPRRERLAALHELVERSAHRAELRRVGRMLRNGRMNACTAARFSSARADSKCSLQAVQRAALPQNRRRRGHETAHCRQERKRSETACSDQTGMAASSSGSDPHHVLHGGKGVVFRGLSSGKSFLLRAQAAQLFSPLFRQRQHGVELLHKVSGERPYTGSA